MNAIATNNASGSLVTEHGPSQPESATILSVISRAASDPSVDIDKMERLLQMHRDMEHRQAEADFNSAMSRVQSHMGRIGTDKRNDQTRSNYATYAKLDRALRPIYTNEGFALSFGTDPLEIEGFVRVTCHVSHTGGFTRKYSIDMASDGKGAKGNDVMTKTHAIGSATQYGMRYLLKMIFNVAIGEEDDDGNAAGNVAGPGYDIAGWRDAIEGVADRNGLDRIAQELKSRTDIPPRALTNIRALWAAKLKEFAK